MSQVSEDPFKFMHAFLPGHCICFAFEMFILKTVHTEIYKCYFFDIFQLNSSTYHEHKVTGSFISYFHHAQIRHCPSSTCYWILTYKGQCSHLQKTVA